MTVILYYNPGCSNARGALALLRERGIEPAIVEYLKKESRAGDLIVTMGAGNVWEIGRDLVSP